MVDTKLSALAYQTVFDTGDIYYTTQDTGSVPASRKQKGGVLRPNATTSVVGVVELADTGEAHDRTSSTVAVTPIGLTLFPKLKTGSYTGDGSTSQGITGVGFTPKVLLIIYASGDGNDTAVVMTSTEHMARDAQGLVALFTAAGGVKDFDNRVLSLDSDGFTVSDDGTDSHPNQNTAAYDYIALG